MRTTSGRLCTTCKAPCTSISRTTSLPPLLHGLVDKSFRRVIEVADILSILQKGVLRDHLAELVDVGKVIVDAVLSRRDAADASWQKRRNKDRRDPEITP